MHTVASGNFVEYSNYNYLLGALKKLKQSISAVLCISKVNALKSNKNFNKVTQSAWEAKNMFNALCN